MDLHRLRTPGTAICVLVLGTLVAGCGSNEEEDATTIDAHAEVSEFVTTVVNVHWTTENPSSGYVEYGPTKDLGLETPMVEQQTTDHVQPLLGLLPDTTYYYRVVSWDGDAGKSEVKSIRTGYLPPGMPELEVVGTGNDQYIVTTRLGTSKGVYILNPEGAVVWYRITDEETDLGHFRARLARDGKGILYNEVHVRGDPVENTYLVHLSFDGSERRAIQVPYIGHDFVEHADGTLGTLAFEDRDMDGVLVRGNKIVEVDPDGNLTEIWNAWDCFDPAEHPGDDMDLGWTWTNALDYDAGDDVYYVSMRNFSSIARVNRQTRECEWVLGFTAPTIEFAPGAAQFQHQHQFHIFGASAESATILLMDNDGPLAIDESRVLEYDLDLVNNVATEVWRFTSTPPVNTFVLGEPNRLAGGNTFINWSAAGQMEVVTPAGENLWKLNAAVGTAFGFHALASSLYEP